MSGVAIGDVEVGPAAADALGQFLAADGVGSGSLGLARLVALGEDGDRDVLAEPVRHHHRAAHLLVGMADVDAEADVHLDGLVELRRLKDLMVEIASLGAYSRSRSICSRRAR